METHTSSDSRPRNPLWILITSTFRGLDLARKVVLNAVFFLLLILFLAAVGGEELPEVPESAALILNPSGNLVEQLQGDAMDRAVGEITGDAEPEVLVQDVVDAIRAAKDDDRIQVLVLDLSQLGGAGLTKLQVVKAEIDAFRESGKTVLAHGDQFLRNQYYLASAANEIHLHHMGVVLLDGYGRYRSYYKEGIDRAEIDWNIFKVGTFKSAVEPYMRDSMSEPAREANEEWMGDLWRTYLEDVAAARGLSTETLNSAVDDMVEQLRVADGQAARQALDAGLVDQLVSRDQVRDRLIELVGEDEETHSFHYVTFQDYLTALGEDRPSRNTGSSEGKVAVVVAKGTILDGSQPPGTIGGDSTAKLLRRARNDEDVKSIVLRVDSGGGSAFASEVIRREMVLAREEGKKVVISMGTVAASGGYWIATASDEIWASPNTITGSIGIFGMMPTYQKPLAKHLGTRVDGTGTNWLAGALRLDRELDPRLGEAIQLNIERGYREFLSRVGEARGMTVEEVDKIAQGRVWSGADAYDLGLVDQLGELSDAIASAAAMAELGDDPTVEFIENELDFTDQLLLDILAQASVWMPEAWTPAARSGAPSIADHVIDRFEDELEFLSQFNDPHHAYARCFCEAE